MDYNTFTKEYVSLRGDLNQTITNLGVQDTFSLPDFFVFLLKEKINLRYKLNAGDCVVPAIPVKAKQSKVQGIKSLVPFAEKGIEFTPSAVIATDGFVMVSLPRNESDDTYREFFKENFIKDSKKAYSETLKLAEERELLSLTGLIIDLKGDVQKGYYIVFSEYMDSKRPTLFLHCPTDLIDKAQGAAIVQKNLHSGTIGFAMEVTGMSLAVNPAYLLQVLTCFKANGAKEIQMGIIRANNERLGLWVQSDNSMSAIIMEYICETKTEKIFI